MDAREPGLAARLTMMPESPSSGLIVQAERSQCIPAMFACAGYYAIVKGDFSTLRGNVVERRAYVPTGCTGRARVDGRNEVARHQKAQVPECTRCFGGHFVVSAPLRSYTR